MMNRIMKPRAAALALAAPLLFTAPALADHGKQSKRADATLSIQTENGGLYLNIGDRGYGSIGYNTNRHYGHRDYRYGDRYYGDDRQQRRRAIRACRQAIRSEADYIGFRDVDFERRAWAERIGPAGFRVTFGEVEFEGRRRDFERPVTCIVRRGDRVVDIQGIPQPGHRGHGHGRRHHGYYK